MRSLTGQERILRTLAGEAVDRIPVAPFIHVNYLREFYGQEEPDAVELTIKIYEEFGFDLIHRNCTPAYDDIALQGENWDCRVERVARGGKNEDICYRVRTPEGELTQTVAIRWSCPYDCEVAPAKYLIQTEHDFELLRKYQPPVEQFDVAGIRRAKALVGERGIVAPWIQGAFNHLGYMYRALDQVAVDPYLRPDFYRQMMEYFLDRNIQIATRMVDAGAEMLSVGINIASGKIFGPDFVREYVIPYERRLNDALRERGAGVINHNCGRARNLLPLYREIGATIYESLTPEPYGDTVLAEAVAVLGPHVALMGGFDQIHLLRKGSPAQIERRVCEMLETTGDRCRFILATSDYFNEGTPPANIEAFAQAGRKYGVRC